MSANVHVLGSLKRVIQDDIKGQVFVAPDYSATATSVAYAVTAVFDVHPRGTDWRVLGGVIPGPIPVEWVRVGDTIQDHGYEGEVTGVRDSAPGVRVVECGHVSFAKVKRQDFVYVTGTNHTKGGPND
ncbi:hypothetical protein [Microbacterium testaceum]|uniref:hypothetical protein n=1 Tax=Microbacterium testaceum TaxID=2033 RepID=UPI000B14F6BF|nr:hypothetical protein [Microbacterium testaceum]